jgi:hypothetical protein
VLKTLLTIPSISEPRTPNVVSTFIFERRECCWGELVWESFMGSLAIYKNGFPWGSCNFIFFPDSPKKHPKSAISMDLGWRLVRCVVGVGGSTLLLRLSGVGRAGCHDRQRRCPIFVVGGPSCSKGWYQRSLSQSSESPQL